MGYIGLALGLLFLLVWIPMCAAVAIPSFVKAKEMSQLNACINNMRMIDAAKEQVAMEQGKTDGDALDDVAVEVYMKMGRPVCPADGTYSYNPPGQDPECSVHGELENAMQPSSR